MNMILVENAVKKGTSELDVVKKYFPDKPYLYEEIKYLWEHPRLFSAWKDFHNTMTKEEIDTLCENFESADLWPLLHYFDRILPEDENEDENEKVNSPWYLFQDKYSFIGIDWSDWREYFERTNTSVDGPKLGWHKRLNHDQLVIPHEKGVAFLGRNLVNGKLTYATKQFILRAYEHEESYEFVL